MGYLVFAYHELLHHPVPLALTTSDRAIHFFALGHWSHGQCSRSYWNMSGRVLCSTFCHVHTSLLNQTQPWFAGSAVRHLKDSYGHDRNCDSCRMSGERWPNVSPLLRDPQNLRLRQLHPYGLNQWQFHWGLLHSDHAPPASYDCPQNDGWSEPLWGRAAWSYSRSCARGRSGLS